MAVVYQRPHALLDVSTHYCPGCTHGIIHKLVAQALDELDIEAVSYTHLDVYKRQAYRCLDREAKGADPEKIQREAFSCDTYFCSSNAVTEAGELYNVDGIGNRVAAMIYGPKSVIVVVGYNKIVPDLEAARVRMRHTAAPANATRIDRRTTCKVLGICRDCHSADRICCDYVVMSQQKVKLSLIHI